MMVKTSAPPLIRKGLRRKSELDELIEVTAELDRTSAVLTNGSND